MCVVIWVAGGFTVINEWSVNGTIVPNGDGKKFTNTQE
jgi:hypothetical protein